MQDIAFLLFGLGIGDLLAQETTFDGHGSMGAVSEKSPADPNCHGTIQRPQEEHDGIALRREN
jgi:hypothetical protein